ncbi:unnamed protein product [Brachionus calyciflorus]|uniref:phosphoinositide 5-phosphatase n=1 Tax=Brachionus calyciflorus TaxID=104777 RepID=A0A813SAI5_9BILA|nr:unnamed protein product [Brachionus calyciflorus]
MNIRKFCSVKVYAFGNSYILSSDCVKDEKLQIRMTNNSVCVNSLTNDEWNQLTNAQTNSVMSPSFASIFTGYGCLGLLSTSVDQTNQFQQTNVIQMQQINNRKNDSASMLHFLLFVKDAQSVGTVRSFEIMKITEIFALPLNDDSNYNYFNQSGNNNQNVNSDFISDIRKLLCSGTFYFSLSSDPNLSFDLTLSTQARNLQFTTNKKFLWNYNLHIPLRRLNVDTNLWLLKIICGYVEIKKILIYAKSYRVGLISRLSTDRVGARFLCRGINDHGNCANFVETEQVIYSTETDEEISFLQVRGSVPVFFEQTGIQLGAHRIKISRSIQACYPAFERHINSLLQDYGSSIYVLNLLGTKGDEEDLTDFYHKLCEYSRFAMQSQLFYTNFDYHQEMKNNKLSTWKLWKELSDTFFQKNYFEGVFFYSKTSENDSIIKTQTKIIRTNCMDCLDRTNCVQAYVAKEMLRFQLRGLVDSESDLRKFTDVLGQMWVANGDNISRIYAGTSAIQGRSVTKDITTSISRAFQNNFLDDDKHDSIESFLYSMSRNYGQLNDRVSVLMSKTFLRLPYTVLKTIVQKKETFTAKEKCKIMIGTWNINGGLSECDMEKLNLNEWLIDGHLHARKTGLGHLDSSIDLSKIGEIDIFAIGFEEIVDLSAQSIVKASEENAAIWRQKINEFLKRHGDYVELINENLQLVGVCLFVFVLKKHVGAIREVSVSKSKTGFGGTAGNKGAVLLRFIYYNTSMCFVCSHFAAHQKEIKQRNDDFKQIYEQSSFSGQKGKSKFKVKNHDYIFWSGDLNYRIDMENTYCRGLINERNWKVLLEADQLSIQRREQNVFREFIEAPISFPPTYKYNLFEDTYDRSEKCRVPAWTDRVLWRKRIYNRETEADYGKCLYYGRADIRLSDHRPVACLLEVEVDKVIPKHLVEELHKVFLSVHGSFQVVLTVTTHTNKMDDRIRKELLNLFMNVPTFVAYREFNNNLYISYADGKYAYDALAQYQNYQLQCDDLTVIIKVENEKKYLKIIEEELMDCLTSLDYCKNNIRKTSIIQDDVKVIDLLSDDTSSNGGSSGSFMSYISVPAQLHSNVSIMNNMHHLKSSEYDSLLINTDSRHEHYNPNPSIIKALSNSNLEVLNHGQSGHRFAHSEANLLDLSNSELFTQTKPLPSRPPPPPPVPTKPKLNEQPLIQISSDDNSGFDDDFGSLAINDTKMNVPTKPPPLPPKPTFSLFEDSFEPVQPQVSQPFKSQPPIPALPLIQKSSQPPPLPPLPANTKTVPPLPPKPVKAHSYLNELPNGFNINSNVLVDLNGSKSNNSPPPLPPPPKLPPRIPQPSSTNQVKTDLTSDDFDEFFSKRENPVSKIQQSTQNSSYQNNPFDPFEDSFVPKEAPLPPPRMNHFS